MELTAKIYIAGHRGMVGSGLERKLRKEGYHNIVTRTSAELGVEIAFRGKDESEEGYIVKNNSEYKLEEGKVVVKVDSKYYRPTEVDLLIGDPTKAMTKLGWKPKYDLAALVKEMVASDITLFKKELHIKQSGL